MVSPQGLKYYAIIVDDCTRFTLQRRNLSLYFFFNFKKLVENQFFTEFKVFQCYGGDEFDSFDFATYLCKNDIQQQVSCRG